MNRSIEFLVVGGGLIGLLTAKLLHQSGVDVALVEKGEIGRESSWAGGGIISPLYPWRYPDAVTQLALWGQRRYPKLCDQLASETGIDPEWTQSGLLMPNLSEKEIKVALEWAERYGYPMAQLNSEQIGDIEPHLSHFSSALWMESVAQIRNPRLVQSLKRSLELSGVPLIEGFEVDRIVESNGRVSGVEAGGVLVSAQHVIVCGGAWSGEILKRAGVELSISPVKGQMLLLKSEPDLLKRITLLEGHYLIPRRDGRVLIGSTLEHDGFNKETTDNAKEELLAAMEELAPELNRFEVEMQWSGLRPGSSNQGIPFIGSCGPDGLFINSGHFRNGVVLGYASAQLLVDMALGHEPIINPAPYLAD
ncbi:MAG: glycine oxidase ThiO [Gammaproteobacteria bacterium]|nr:glycine oxidase ThiO [Gammaproteobacteria bacterium]